jgi:hypothetical protein
MGRWPTSSPTRRRGLIIGALCALALSVFGVFGLHHGPVWRILKWPLVGLTSAYAIALAVEWLLARRDAS